MKFEVIIPNYNGARLIEKNLPDVFESVRKYDVVISIVDDASQDADFDSLKKFVHEFSEKNNVQINLLRNNKNLGFSSTVNKAGLRSTADLLILLNSDVRPSKNFLDSVVPQFEKNEQLFGVGCMDQSIEDNKTVLRGRGIGTFHKGFLVHKRGEVDKDHTLWISGGSSVIRTEFFKKLGGFDPLYNPFYWEDIDLSYRALKSGYGITFNNQSVVEHRHEEGAIKKNFSQFRVSSIAYRNQLFFMWKNVTDTAIIREHFTWLLIQKLKAVVRLDGAFCVGLALAFVCIPQIMSKRKNARKLFVKSDREITERFEQEYFHDKK